MPSPDQDALQQAFADHSRRWQGFKFVYPVISRRAGGLSIGVNLNTDKKCNFACPYCQVDRSVPGSSMPASADEVMVEVEKILNLYQKDELIFPNILPEHRRLKDISFSGDGEPTLSPLFPEIAKRLADQNPCKLVLITNSTLVHLPKVREGIAALCSKNGEVWAKLDAGSEPFFKVMSGSKFSLDTITQHIADLLSEFPGRVQTMLCQIDGSGWNAVETYLYTERLKSIRDVAQKRLREVQLYTTARHTASNIGPEPSIIMDTVANQVRYACPGLKVGIYA
jgi:wyosine [tRNA(Phe)-imidazoG37] synthetase (radical SAM superfamily)